MTTKELKADNLLLQAKLDDALAEITELKNLVEHMEKEKYNGIKCVDEPGTSAFSIDQINVGFLHRCALEQLSQPLPADYVTAPQDDEVMISIAHDLVCYIENEDGTISDSVGEVVEYYEELISQSKE